MVLKSILATDCGSTTTKAVLIEHVSGEYRLTYRGEAPTTVEAPFEDVTRGVLNAVMEVEELSGRKIIENDKIISPANETSGVDIYIYQFSRWRASNDGSRCCKIYVWRKC